MNTEGLNQRSRNSLPQHSGPPPIVEKDAIAQEAVVGSLANGDASVPEVASGSGEPISEPWLTTSGTGAFDAKYDIAPGSGDSELEQSAIDKPPVGVDPIPWTVSGLIFKLFLTLSRYAHGPLRQHQRRLRCSFQSSGVRGIPGRCGGALGCTSLQSM